MMHPRELDEAWLREVEGAVEFVTLMDGDARLLYVNHPQPGAEDYVGRSVFDFVAPADHDVVREAVGRASSTGLPEHFSSEATGPNGATSTYSNWVVPVPRVGEGAVAIVATDVTHLGRVEAELEQSESALRSLVDHLPDSILIVDRERRIQFVNRLEHGFVPEDVLGRSADSFVPESDRRRVVDAIERVLATGETTTYESGLDTPDGHRRFRTRAAPIPLHGQIDRVMLVATDITREHEAKLERERLTAQLQQAQKMESLGKLTGGVAHDFNNLLTAIGGNLELAGQEGVSEEERRHHVDQALGAVQRAAELTGRLLAFARRQPLRPQVVDLGALVRGMHGLLDRTLGETVEVRTEIEDDLARCTVDAAQMESALLNLAVNARDAMPRGGALLIRCSNVRPEWAAAAPVAPHREVRVEVVDEGTGMTPEVLEQAFEPFFTTKDVGEGSGLGLSMVYGFVSQSGGEVRIYSDEGRGTTVEIVLPATTAEPAEEPVSGAPPGVARGRGERVLVVEDDPRVRALTVRILQQLGYRTADARTAALAIDRLAAEDDVALVLSDVVLAGGVSGFELADEVRKDSPALPFVFVSGDPDPARAGRPHAAVRSWADRSGPGGPALLRKPFTIAELARAIDEALERD